MSTIEITARLRQAGCVFAEDEAALLAAHAGDTGASLDELVRRRCAGEPLEYVVGWAEFRGLRIPVTPGVFVPRRRTEYLAELAIEFAAGAGTRPLVVDLCCGAGAIAAVLHAEVPGARLHAADADAAAVELARRNLGSAVNVYLGDLFAALPESLRGQVDVLVANVPYVPTRDIALLPPEAREHERRMALDGGVDGLDIARRVYAGAPEWLAAGGTVLVELDEAQARLLADEVDGAGLTTHVRQDAADEQCVLTGTLSPRVWDDGDARTAPAGVTSLR